MYEAYLLYYLRMRNPKFGVCMHLGVTVTLFLISCFPDCLKHICISYIIQGRNSKFGVRMHLEVTGRSVAYGFGVTVTLISGFSLR